MKVASHLVEERRRDLVKYFQGQTYVPLGEVCRHFKVSAATARRDLTVLAARQEIVRTYGGALSECNRRFPSFREREKLQARNKRRIAVAAYGMIKPGTHCFLDFGTTAYAVAQELKRRPVGELQIVTNSLPVAELLTGINTMRVHVLGGEVMHRQSALLGTAAHKALEFYPLEFALLSAEAANHAGVWNSQGEVVEFQRAVMARTRQSVLCLDASKLKHSAPAFLAPWTRFNLLITNESADGLDFVGCPRLSV